MRVRLGLFAVALTACGRLSFDTDPTPDQLVPDDPNLRLWLKFDGIPIVDSAPNGFGVACGALGCPTLVPGVLGSAGRFGGAAILRSIGLGTFVPTAFTFAAWSRLDAATIVRSTLAAKAYGNADRNSWELLRLENGDFTVGGDTVDLSLYGNTVLSPATWHHLAVTWDGTLMNAYLDDVIFIASRSVPILWDETPVTIGGDLDSAAEVQSWRGDLDEVRFYDRVLSRAELTTLATP